ncbi:hypothetical protein DPEC_G00205350 [Dallia pectoralis]|uniref:Uncharacterized protein n=1 Tax=Dallia pectoralis TaxID=75939 RepID=A0ACC2G4V6_DALPE|nr:hypothetical protein DPEC_G00205350 [Dallia pectoralis]
MGTAHPLLVPSKTVLELHQGSGSVSEGEGMALASSIAGGASTASPGMKQGAAGDNLLRRGAVSAWGGASPPGCNGTAALQLQPPLLSPGESKAQQALPQNP